MIKTKRLMGALAAVLLVMLQLATMAYARYEAAEDNFQGYVWKLDAKDEEALPRNFRTCQGTYIHKVEDKYLPYFPDEASLKPTATGLASLNISGSGQMSFQEFQQVVEVLKQKATGPIYDVDLRQEAHGYFDGNAVSWYGKRNWGNRHFKDDSEAILQDEQQRLLEAQRSEEPIWVAATKVSQKTLKAYQEGTKKPAYDAAALPVENVMTEEEAAQQLGVGYFRITALDHVWPEPEYIDQFISWYKTLPSNAWLHFHCKAGKGRTTTYMVLVDMMKNPGLPLEDILRRQYLIGGTCIVYEPEAGSKEAASYRNKYYVEKAERIRQLYQYVQENHQSNYATSWKIWLQQKHLN